MKHRRIEKRVYGLALLVFFGLLLGLGPLGSAERAEAQDFCEACLDGLCAPVFPSSVGYTFCYEYQRCYEIPSLLPTAPPHIRCYDLCWIWTPCITPPQS